MIQGTTPLHVLLLPFLFSDLAEIEVLYSQDGILVLRKTKRDMSVDSDGKTVRYRLTQEETLLFGVGDVKVQVRVLLNTGEAYADEQELIPVKEILRKEVLEVEADS